MIQLIDVLQPLFIALGIYFVLKPGADALSKKGFPIMLSYITMLMLAILIVLSAGFFAYQQADNFLSDEERMDEYTLLLDERWSDLKEMPLVGKSLLDAGATVDGTLDDDLASMGFLDEGSGISEALNGLLSSVGMFFITGITVLFFLLFIIFEASLLPGRIERAYPGGASERAHMIRDQIEASVNTYVVVKTGVGFGTGVCAGLVMLVFGIDLWFTWALLTFLLNYVPYIGSLLATIPPILLGFILLDPAMLVLLTVLLLTNQQLWGNIIETLGRSSARHLTCASPCGHGLFLLGLGHYRYDSLHPARGHFENCSREHRCHPPPGHPSFRTCADLGRSMSARPSKTAALRPMRSACSMNCKLFWATPTSR